jgi:nucleoside-diphosphate-sugar epimerase
MAAVVPPLSEKNNNLCCSVNINGSKNVIDSINDKNHIKPIVYVSSSSVMGPTQSQNPPVTTSMEPKPVSIYSKSKLDAEILISDSKARYCILRLASVLDSGSDYSDDLLQLLFDFPLEARNELILDRDAATAIVTAGELLINGNSIDGRTFFIGGGRKNGFQVINNYFINEMFGAMGIGMLSEECFTKDLSKYAMDWYDTSESNDLLKYQNHSFNDYINILEKRTLSGGPVIKYMAPRLKKSMEMQSPYYNKQNGGE